MLIGEDEEIWKRVKRQMRIEGEVKRVRIEKLLWWKMEDIEERENIKVRRIIGKIYEE